MTLKFLVSSSLRYCSSALRTNPPLHPLPLRWATGLPAVPFGAKKNRWTCGLTCEKGKSGRQQDTCEKDG